MLLRRLRWVAYAGILLLPGCLVVTCGSTRTLPDQPESPVTTPRDPGPAPQSDSSAGRW